MLYFTNFTFLFKKKGKTYLSPRQALALVPWHNYSSWEAVLLDLVRGLHMALSSEVAPSGLP